MKSLIAWCSLCVLLVSASPVRSEVWRLDLGTPDSPLRDGFQRLTPQDVHGGITQVGWVSPTELEGANHPVPREPFPPPIYTTDLRQDGVQGRGPATLRVTAPPGRYRVWVMAGTGGDGWGQVWDVQLANKAAASAAQATFFGGYAARLLTLDAVVGEAGHLDLDIATRSKWAISAIVIVPEDAWAQLYHDEITGLEREVLLLPDDVLKDWRHTPHEDDTPPLDYTDAERARGFVIHHRPWVTPIWPDTVPRRDEFDPTLKAFLSPDEYEPLTFTIAPLRDFEAAHVSASDLHSDAGDVLPADDIEVRYVQYKVVRPNYKTFGTYYRAPDLLPRLDAPQPLKAGENFRVWLTVHAGPDAAPGIYHGAASVALDGQPAAEVPIMVRVLPIELKKDASVTYSTYYRHPSRYLADAPDDFSRQWWRKKIESDAASMAAHGYNGFRPDISAGINEAGEAVASLEKWARQLAIAQQHGMDVDRPTMADVRSGVRSLYRRTMGKEYPLHLYNVEMPPDRFFDQITAMIAAVEAERQECGLPELLYSLVDEPAATAESVAYTRRVYEAAKRVPGIRTYITVDPTREGFEPLHGVVDVWASPHLNHPGMDRAALAAEGIEVWCYPNYAAGENDHTPVAGARMTYGFARWRAGCPGLIPWIFESWGGDPANNLDALHMEMFNHTTGDAEVLPCTLYEAYREGIDDNRYLTTLERAIEQARAAGLTAEADAAQADLDFVRQAVPVQEVYKYDTGWADASFDTYRWILARRILTLQKALP